MYFTKYRHFLFLPLSDWAPSRIVWVSQKVFYSPLSLCVHMEVVIVCCLTFNNSTETLNLMFLGWKGPFGSQLLRINATLVLERSFSFIMHKIIRKNTLYVCLCRIVVLSPN